MTWKVYLNKGDSIRGELLGESFMARWGNRPWKPNEDDRKAAGKLHTQIVSRITTQPLGYLDGVEKAALDSVYALFEATRKISEQHPDGQHFQILAWHVLNSHVRPFTAKWHRESKRGMLDALDTTDEFRVELAALQILLRSFEDLLAQLRDCTSPPPRPENPANSRESAISEEMAREMPWAIPERSGGVDAKIAKKINDAEKKAIRARRAYYKLNDIPHASGLALSGGGIRSATFSLGVLVALARRGILPQFDYLSTVSGGGYLGSFLTSFLNSPEPKAEGIPIPLPQPSDPIAAKSTSRETGKMQGNSVTNPSGIGLRPTDYPFRRGEGEAEALRHIRHHSKYLASGNLWERVKMMSAQLYGMALNSASLVFLAMVFALFEHWLRPIQILAELLKSVTICVAIVLVLVAVVSPLLLRFPGKAQKFADPILAVPALLLLALLCWRGLDYCHQWIDSVLSAPRRWALLDEKILFAVVGAIPVIASAFSNLFGRLFKRAKIILLLLSSIAAPLFFFGVYLLIYHWAAGQSTRIPWTGGTVERICLLEALAIVGTIIYFLVLNINFTSPHRHYRNKLAEAYLIQPCNLAMPGGPFRNAVSLPLSKVAAERAPYHLINGALNVPSSSNPKMQGRLTDFFLFSPSFCGSPLTGYRETSEWERKDPHLDLGTAMAISGAAAAPQMGLATVKPLRFWLALLNIRLGYWVRNPEKTAVFFGGAPGLWFLLKEMLGWMDEKSPWLNVSDGGHIENLGVYELLRRRCKYIVAVDGEQDQRMTFAGLTTLQRLAAIDLGVRIHIDLDDLRLNEKGLSRSHFRFCRIEYPGGTYGYLLYLKLSLTGNEGEFLRRYRLDEPAFPHHSTADQFFTEAQFEAYRSLGEHVGDKLFLAAIVRSLSDAPSIQMEDWFCELGKSLLEPLPKTKEASEQKHLKIDGSLDPFPSV